MKNKKEDYYGDIAEGYDQLHKEEQLSKLKIIKETLEIKKTDKLLDVGCGTGFSLEFFDCSCEGVEPSAKMAALSKNRAKITIAKAENMPFNANSFDIVISVTAIHNFEDIEKGLSEMKRVGKGKFIFSVLKKSNSFKKIKKLIYEIFNVKKEIDKGKDMIFFAVKK